MQRRIVRVAVFLFAIVVPKPLPAVTFPQFDQLSKWGQSEYLAWLITVTRNELFDAKKDDVAKQIDSLFGVIKPGDALPLGIAEYEGNVDAARVRDLERIAKDPKAPRLLVEAAFFLTLSKNDIQIPPDIVKSAVATMSAFRVESYAGFEARPLPEKRRLVASLVKYAFPDYELLDETEKALEAKKKGEAKKPFWFAPDMKQIVQSTLTKQFPNEGDQPGFAEISRQIDAGNTKSPEKAGPFYEVTVYFLHQLEAEFERRNAEIDGRAVIIPTPKTTSPAAMPTPAVSPLTGACLAFYAKPENGLIRPSRTGEYCSCLGNVYKGLMTTEEEAYYAADFGARFYGGLAQSRPMPVAPGWERLHPASVRCQQ